MSYATLLRSRRSYRSVFPLAAVSVACVALPSSPASAINRSWDDAGGSANKLWSNFGNWSPDGAVASGDDIFIGNFAAAAGDATLLDSAQTIASLTITNGASVTNSTDGGATNDFELIVNGPTSITGAGSTFFVIGGAPDGLDTEGLTVGSGGSVNLNSTTAQGTAVVEIESSVFNLTAGGTLIGQGRIDFQAPTGGTGTNVFSNSGTITANRAPLLFGFAPTPDTLQLSDTGDSNRRFDWDGVGSGVINVNGNQTLDVDISTGTDAWSGTMNLGTGSTLDMRDAWAMDSGVINANTPAFGFILPGNDPNPGAPAAIVGANWTMSGGTIDVNEAWDSLQLDSQLVASGGVINNSGTIIFNGGANIQSGVDFNMIGGDASLVVNSTVTISTPDFNLDGSALSRNVTTINAGGNLDLNLGAGADDGITHTVNMNPTGFGVGQTAELDVTTLDNDWQLDSTGTINVAGGGNALLNGEAFRVFGSIDVSGAGTFLDVNTQTEYNATVNITVGPGAIYNQDGVATYNGGSYTGDGDFRPGASIIAADTTWAVSTVDFDDGNTTINNGATLTVNADSIETGTDGIDGTTTIADTGRIQFNLTGGVDVVFDGDLVYNGNTTSSNFILDSTTGSALRFEGAFADLTINGDGGSLSRIIIGSSARLNINDASEDFRFEGGSLLTGDTNELQGGTINGPGELQAGSGHALTGFGTINAPIDFDGSASLEATGGTLVVNDAILDVGTLGTFDGTGTLEVTTPWNTNVTQTVELNGGVLNGATITNDGGAGINGNGEVAARVINNTRIDAENGGTLTLTDTTNDWDGAGAAGVLNAVSGTLVIVESGQFTFQGEANVGNGNELFVSAGNFDYGAASTVTLSNGGTLRGVATTDLFGTLVVNGGAASSIELSNGDFDFETTSTTTLNGNLSLDLSGGSADDAIIRSGATFSGGGALINNSTSGSALNVLDGAAVNVLVVNNGQMQVQGTAGVGQITGLDFQQNASGELNLDLAGTGLNDFDRITLTGLAQIAGELDLDATGPTYDFGDSFTLISAVGGLSGTFDTIDGVLDGSLPASGGLAVTYTPNAVLATVALLGDANLDGEVNTSDLAILAANFSSTNGTWVTADFSGDSLVDTSDLAILAATFGTSVGPATSPAAVPEPAGLALLGAAGLLVAARRRSHPSPARA